MSGSKPRDIEIRHIALALARADDEYRGFEPFPEPPPDADADWYHDNVEGWPWYRHIAEKLLTQPSLRAILENNTSGKFMQYLLTQEEYDALRARQQHEIALSTKKLQKLCTKIADTMPVKWGWSKDEEAKPWGCIHSQQEEWYCDSCPVQEICPEPHKEWSK